MSFTNEQNHKYIYWLWKSLENIGEYLSDLSRGGNNNLFQKLSKTYFSEWRAEVSELNEQGLFRVVRGMSFPDRVGQKSYELYFELFL